MLPCHTQIKLQNVTSLSNISVLVNVFMLIEREHIEKLANFPSQLKSFSSFKSLNHFLASICNYIFLLNPKTNRSSDSGVGSIFLAEYSLNGGINRRHFQVIKGVKEARYSKFQRNQILYCKIF